MTERIGLLPFWKNYDRNLYLKAAALADELGYDSFWIPEAWGYEVFSLLTEIAVHTKRIKLGTGIVNCFSRSPGLLAMSAATVDEISEGRLILGLGTSGKRVIEGFHAREFNQPLTQVRDVIRVTKTLLSGKRLNESGAKLHDYRPFDLAMRPLRPDVPIYVAALKRKAITSIGELADGWIPTFWPYKELLSGFGYAEECKRVEELYRDKKTRSQAADAIPEAMIEALTIAGDPQHCIVELRRRRDYGIDLPILNLPSNLPWEMVELFIRTMAPSA